MNDLSIDIGGTYIKYAFVNEANQIQRSWKIPTKSKGTYSLYDYIVENIPKNCLFQGIGTSVPGVLNPDGTIVSKTSSTLSELYQTNIRKELQRRTGIQVTAINDGNAAALYEACLGIARNAVSSVTVVIGTGIGGGVCQGRELIKGTTYGAGEFHFIPCYYDDNKRHKLGDFCKTGALRQFYYESTGEQLSTEDIFAQLALKSTAATRAVDRWLYHLSTLLITLAAVYNPELFCIGGAISENKQFIALLSQSYFAAAQQYFRNPAHIATRIVPCSQRNNSNLLGAIVYHRRCISRSLDCGKSHLLV